MKPSPKSIQEIYPRLAIYLKRYWKHFLLSIISMLIVAGSNPLFAWLIKPLINEGFVAKNMEMMIWLPIAIVGVFIIRGVFNFINEYTTSYISGHLVKTIREELFAQLLALPNSYYHTHSTGRVISRIMNDASQISSAGFSVLTVIAKDGVTVVSLLIYLMYLDWMLTLITLITLPIVGWCVRVINKRLRTLSSESQFISGAMLQSLNESVAGARVIKIYGGEEREQQRFQKLAHDVWRNGLKQTAANATSSGITLLMIAIALAIILYLAAAQAQSHQFSAGDFMSFLTAMIMMFDPIKRMTGVMQSLQLGLAAAQSVFDFLDEETESNSGKETFPQQIKHIAFQDIVYRYPEAEKNSLHHLHLCIPEGKVYALVGASGCGKSTLANMLPRFFDPTSGTISINDIDIKDLKLQDLRKNIALVSQDVVLFNGTIAENIAYGSQSQMEEQAIIEAAKAANAWEFIQTLPHGLQTEIGENGMKLSGGQRQRLAIARAILKNAPILILDEATSALDNESERIVQNALEKLMKNRTTIVIAHRLSTIEQADSIVVMHDGQIIEQGTHAELLALNGRYADLNRLQIKEKPTAI